MHNPGGWPLEGWAGEGTTGGEGRYGWAKPGVARRAPLSTGNWGIRGAPVPPPSPRRGPAAALGPAMALAGLPAAYPARRLACRTGAGAAVTGTPSPLWCRPGLYSTLTLITTHG